MSPLQPAGKSVLRVVIRCVVVARVVVVVVRVVVVVEVETVGGAQSKQQVPQHSESPKASQIKLAVSQPLLLSPHGQANKRNTNIHIIFRSTQISQVFIFYRSRSRLFKFEK